jgi:hypothetical protein
MLATIVGIGDLALGLLILPAIMLTAASASGLSQTLKPFHGQTFTRLHVTFARSTG